ncbi:dienelactone hydrolase family protein [Demequina sp.]|uniref:dienelactone hydrolase family protein n=1 Tax=Demequina sp. TaxID=2050685 RepID=UPI003A850149
MATVVLLHSALGLTSHLHAWADALREDGHHVVTPDLFGGRTFADLETAVAYVDSEGGPPAFIAAATAQTVDLGGPRVYVGFSLGGAVAEILALTRGDASGLVVLHGALSPAWFGVDAWPDGLTAQLHYASRDPWVEPEENAAFLALAGDACEEYVYDGDGHLFAFEGWHEYEAQNAHRLYEHVTDFLASLD